MAKILSIEDSSFERKVLANMLKDADTEHELIEAENGEEGLQKLEDADPDLVLLDMRMPGKDGVALLNELQERQAKTVVVSVVQDEQTIEEAMEAGAVGYVKKPVEKDRLLEAIDTALEQHAGDSE